jgi:glycosyltransferase involved in cell wall biosynthesis
LKVSIIIPVYNGSNYLAKAIDSALFQDYQNIEIIVINDGSRDNDKTKNIALSYGEKIVYLEKSNGGVASALNLGISRMKGDFFSWLSHDDLYTTDKISKQINFIKKNNFYTDTTILFSNYYLIDFEGKIFHTTNLEPGNSSNFRAWLAAYSYLNGCTLLIPKKLFDVAGLFNEKLKHTQDYELWFRMSYHANFIFHDDLIVYSRQHPDQDSRSKNLEAFKEVFFLKKSFLYQLSKQELKNNIFIFFKMFYTHRQIKLLFILFKQYIKVQF